MNTFLSKSFYLVLFGFSSFLLTGQQSQEPSGNQFRGAEYVRESKFSSLPSYIEFRKGSQIDIDELNLWMRSNFKFDPAMGFDLIRKETDNLGHVHYRYQQSFNGNPVEDAIWIVHTQKSKIYSLNGLIYNSISGASTASLTESLALEKAKEYVGATVYKWELPEEEKHLKWETQDPGATYLPKGELVYVTSDYSFSKDSYRLAYKFNIYAHEPVSRQKFMLTPIPVKFCATMKSFIM